jgi:hypothetical protein
MWLIWRACGYGSLKTAVPIGWAVKGTAVHMNIDTGVNTNIRIGTGTGVNTGVSTGISTSVHIMRPLRKAAVLTMGYMRASIILITKDRYLRIAVATVPIVRHLTI